VKVFFTHSYFYQLDPKQWDNRTPYPPLATITALAYIESNGFEAVDFYDGALDPGPYNCLAELEKSSPEVVVIYEDGFNYLTKMCLTNMREACFEMIGHAKKIGATVIVSGSDATDHWKNYHDHGADFIIHGEGEQTLLELLNHLRDGKETGNIEGSSLILNGNYHRNPSRSNVRDLDIYPMAKWSVIDIDAYRRIWESGKFPFTLNISTTRGCPFKCNWCAKPIYGNRYNSRSPENVVKEINYLAENYGVQHFWVTDDIFGLKPGWVKTFKDLILQNKLHIKYKIQSRADLLMEPSVIDDLAASGLEEVWIGAESGSQKILDAMDKGITLEQIKKATGILQSKNVRVAYFIQFGYLGETEKDIRSTIDMIFTNQPDDIGISVSYPLPGTKFHDIVKEQMGAKENWKDSDDLDLMFKGTYSSEFYKKLQRYVHYRFRVLQGIKKLKGQKGISSRYLLLLPVNIIRALMLKPKF